MGCVGGCGKEQKTVSRFKGSGADPSEVGGCRYTKTLLYLSPGAPGSVGDWSPWLNGSLALGLWACH